MKIALIVEAFPVLSQTFVLNQITGLIDRGHEVDIYAEFHENSSKVHPDVEKYDLLSRTFYHPPMPQARLHRFLQGVWLFLINVPIAPLLLLRSLNVFKYKKDAASLRLLYAVIPFVKRRPIYDVIQCHFGLLGIKGMLLRDVGALQGKHATAFHGVDISQNLRLLGEAVYSDLFKAGDLFLPISQHWQNRLIELGCDPGKIIVHRMGIDCQRFTFLPRSLNPGEPIRLISVARLTEKKGIEFGIRAVANVLTHFPDLEYNIVGDGDLRTELAELIHTLGIAEQVKLLGWRNQTEVVELLQRSHILLAPSVTAKDGNQEGIPVALMEAMAMGLPIISTYHTGIPELVEDDVSGFLVPERDVAALADKISDLVHRPEHWAAIADAARRRVEQLHNINQLNDQLIAIYQHLLKSDALSSPINQLDTAIDDRSAPLNV
jgi:colanic acid/amylovoran biosynthesis glycosyltransferase